MVRMRKDVWKLPANDKTLFWYGQAITVLKARPITDKTSWWSLAAMHGIDSQLWIDLGYLDPAVKLPFDPTKQGFWNQCQHGSWYFLSWHRAYLAAFEAILLDVIVKQHGPGDWALPYWNYDPTAPKLKFPAAFAPELLDDGSKNPLWVKERYGRTGNGTITIKPADVPVKDLWRADEFFDEPNHVPTSFGGTRTAFHHDAGAGAGKLERTPHGPVHNLVGGTIEGGDPTVSKDNGLMSMFQTAGIDPIFWLHHSNIDRLWESWLTIRQPHAPPDAHQNPTDLAWLDQPAGQFVMPRPDGTTFTTAARQVLNTRDPSLNYEYQVISVPGQLASPLVARLNRLGVAPADANALAGAFSMAPKITEMVGQNNAAVRISGAATEASVQLDNVARNRLQGTLSTKSFSNLAEGATPAPPDRVFLALENITSATDAGVFHVYVNLPKGADPAQHPENLAGVVSLFGAREASRTDGPHAGSGLTETLEITDIVDAMHLTGDLNKQQIDVKFVPQTPISDNSKVDVGRMRIYRQGG